MTSARVFLLLLLVFATLAASCLAAAAADFTDVPKYQWAWSDIMGVSNAGIATGYPDGTYRPDAVVTRDQMAVYIARALAGGDAQVPSGPAAATFSDVPIDYWAFRYIMYCADPAQGVVQGYPDGTYKPGDPVNRDAMAVYIARAVAGGDAHVPSGPATATFSDVPTDQWAFKYIEYCAAVGRSIVKGYPDGTYKPGNPVTRDQMAVYICRAFNLSVPPQPYNVTDYFSLTQAITWMSQSGTGTYGGGSTDFTTQVVSGAVSLSGQSYVVLTEYPDGFAQYWLTSADGLRLGGMHDASGNTTVMTTPLLIPNGLDPGDTDTQTVNIAVNGVPAGQASLSYQFVGPETATVPVGSFADCMKLDITLTTPQGSSRAYCWAAKGIGFVEQDSRPFGGSDFSNLVGYAVPSASAAAPFNVTDRFPLDQGDTWNYLAPWGSLTATISGTVTLLGQVYSSRTDSFGHTEDWLTTTTGAYMGGFVDSGQSQATIVPPIPFPNGLTLGQTVTGNALLYQNGVVLGAGTLNLNFPEVDDVTVPAGTFANCMKLEVSENGPGGGEHLYEWLAPGVGEVMQDETAFQNTNNDSYVLQSATIGSAHYP
jgi:hypothetical protein